jgi:hypothetical protein
MCEVRLKKQASKNVQCLAAQKMDCDEPHLTPNEETQPIQWTKQRTNALVAADSLWLTKGVQR